MAIVKNNFGVSRLDEELIVGGKGSKATDDDDEQELQKRNSDSDSESTGGDEDDDQDDDDDDDDEDDMDEDEDDIDSGAGSDDFDLSELGEIGEEFCQVGDNSCSIPYELYDLKDLGEILSVDAWNELLTEEERFSLSEYLPDMDQDTFIRTLKQLFSGNNFHFGNPVAKLFDLLKGGLCQPRVKMYRQGLHFLQKREHYHRLRKYQNSMVGNCVHMRDAWSNCKGYSMQEKLRVLSIRRSQKSSVYENMQGVGGEIDGSHEGLLARGQKDIRVGSRMGSRAMPPAILGQSLRDWSMMKHEKQNHKGNFKFAGSKNISGKDIMGNSQIHQGLGTKSRPNSSKLTLPWQDTALLKYDEEPSHSRRGQIRSENELEEPSYAGTMAKSKYGRKQEFLKSEDYYGSERYADSLSSLKNQNSNLHARNRPVNSMADMEMLRGRPVGDRNLYDYPFRDAGKKPKYLDKFQLSALEDQMNVGKDRALPLKGMPVDWPDESPAFRHSNPQGAFSRNQPVKFDGWDARPKKSNVGQELRTSKHNLTPFPKGKSYIVPTQTIYPPDYRGKTFQTGGKMSSIRNGGLDMEDPRQFNRHTQSQSEETESDSSDQDDDEEEEYNPLKKKLGYGGRSTTPKPALNPIKADKITRKGKEFAESLNYSSNKVMDIGEQMYMPGFPLSSSGRSKGKMLSPNFPHHAASSLQESVFPGSVKLSDDGKLTNKSMKNGHMLVDPVERMQIPMSKVLHAEKKRKGKVDYDNSVSQPKYTEEYTDEEDGKIISKSGKKGIKTEALENPMMSLVGCNSVSKKRKGKADLTYMEGLDGTDYSQCGPDQQTDDPSSLKKRGKRQVEAQNSPSMVVSEPLVPDREVADIEPEAKPVKKPYVPITPTVHTGFSFSIVHLLTASRLAMVTPLPDDGSQIGNLQVKTEAGVSGDPENAGSKNLPALTVQEIVSRVKLNPGDPCILETQEPLQDLVRGVLKIFSSKTAPLGAKSWKALVVYEKTTKSWSWIGPVLPTSSSDPDIAKEETSPEAWGLPHKMLVKLVDSFANWLKSGQETLQQIGSLPPPPMALMQPVLDEKERFRDLRAQKSLTTISPNSEEVRAYFRREELLRYLVPDRAFSYTAADGKKTTVAPLRRCGGKPTSKARDHFMLKIDRPPHVTILCLVRDAAARLPGGIGTRADVCTLIRDSQYVVEDVGDAQVNQVVSGALDRLHYERDPCVLFDGDRKLWVYMHRNREEEDFDDDGTASTKKWKRQRKDPAEESGAVPGVFLGAGEQNSLASDLNLDQLSMGVDDRMEVMYNKDLRPSGVEKSESFVLSGQIDHQGQPVAWGLNPLQENKMVCQENTTTEVLDDGTFNRERTLLSASFLYIEVLSQFLICI
ncbi:hypothetical protein MKW92_010251 [Papaver armeniacum]|nr:hypothetical protein MKW92_010251 [Papaver armeniacum]